MLRSAIKRARLEACVVEVEAEYFRSSQSRTGGGSWRTSEPKEQTGCLRGWGWTAGCTVPPVGVCEMSENRQI